MNKSLAENQVGYLKYLLETRSDVPEIKKMLEMLDQIWADGKKIYVKSKSGEILNIEIEKLKE